MLHKASSQALVNTVMNHCVPLKVGDFLTK